jgi:penicillin amidase
MQQRPLRVLAVTVGLIILATLSGCAPLELLRYALWPDYPTFEEGASIALPGLVSPVQVTQRSDGLWRVRAASERDGMIAIGYLQARDRAAQLDLFRHIARGRLAELVGNRRFLDRTAVETDILNRFLGFARDARLLYEQTEAGERAMLDAFVGGVNAWLAQGHLSLEHRLLGVREVAPWTAEDSLAIYLMIMHGLGGNADREVRRLAIACASGVDAMERIWPTDVEFTVHVLPDEDLRPDIFAVAPAVVPELAAELPELCAAGARDTFRPQHAAAVASSPLRLALLQPDVSLRLLNDGWTASNNWVVAGPHTVSGKPILSSDPHLPHMNPPIVWGMELEVPGYHMVGFTLPGLYRVVFGHNGAVAWGATTNHVDRQDLVVHRPRRQEQGEKTIDGYEVDGAFVPFEYRRERFSVAGGEAVDVTVRFTRDGPLLNDLDPGARGRIPLTALRVVPFGHGADLVGARRMNYSRDIGEFTGGLAMIDLGCSSWVSADSQGGIAYRSPCLLPRRDGWRGTFPVPGWTTRYDWRGLYAKDELPASTNPGRGWLATANNQIVPSARFPSAYNNDVSAPSRFERIAQRLGAQLGKLDRDRSAAIQVDSVDESWRQQRARFAAFCSNGGDDELVATARRRLCAWDGDMSGSAVEPTLYVLLTNALLDRALADDLPGGAEDPVWLYTQSLLQFEVDVQWLLTRDNDAAVWDDARTPQIETRDDIVESAFADAVAFGRERYGDDLQNWTWGEVRPFVLRHPFAGEDGLLGRVVNSKAKPIDGGSETVFKQQAVRSDREHMRSAVGPVARFTIDMNDPWAATFSMAGGESGWPRAPHYGDLLDDWCRGEGRPLTPAASAADLNVHFVPRAGA